MRNLNWRVPVIGLSLAAGWAFGFVYGFAPPAITVATWADVAAPPPRKVVNAHDKRAADQPTPPTIPEPPGATLRIGGAEQRAGIGTFCWWPFGCVDYAGIVTGAESMRVRSPFKARLGLEAAEPIREMELQVFGVQPQDGRTIDGGRRMWRPRGDIRLTFEPALQREQTVDMTLDPGLYVVNLGVYWGGRGGDAQYGFLIEVESNRPTVYLPRLMAMEPAPELRTSPDSAPVGGPDQPSSPFGRITLAVVGLKDALRTYAYRHTYRLSRS